MDNKNEPLKPLVIKQGLFLRFKFFLPANKFIIIFIVLLCIISFSVTGFLLLANKKTSPPSSASQNNVIPVSSPTSPLQKTIPNTPPTATPTANIPPIDPTANWNAYISSKYSYSLKYPLNWTAQITTQQDPKILEYVVFNPVATKAGTLSITLSYGTRTYTQALALDPQIGETILIASVSSTKKNSKDSNGYKAANVIVPFGLNTIIFNAKDAYANLFNQMLSTLKLLK